MNDPAPTGSSIAAAVTAAAPAPATTTTAPASTAPAPAAAPAATTPTPVSNLVADAPTDAPAAPVDTPAPAPSYDGLKMPEGFEVKDPKQFDEFKGIIAEHKVPPEAAQKLIDMYAADLKREAVEGPRKAWEDLQKQWQGEIQSDPEIGGTKTVEVTSAIAKVINQVTGSPEAATKLRQAFVTTGAGNNPDIVRFLGRLAKGMVEGGTVNGSGPSPSGQAVKTNKSYASTLYPNQASTTQE